MKWLLCLALSASALHADYTAWFGNTPAFRYSSSEERLSTLTVEWGPDVSWPQSTPRQVRQPHPLPKETLDKLVQSFGKGPWNVYLEANDGKGFWVLNRRLNEEVAGTEVPGDGEPRLLSAAERIEKAKALFAGIGYPAETLVTRRRSQWVDSEGTPGKETDIAAGVGMSATIGGLRLLPASAHSAAVGFDRYGRTTEIRLIWRKVQTEGEFKLVSREQAEAAILAGQARTLYFGFAQKWGARPTPEQREIAASIEDEARNQKALGLPPSVVKRRIVITGAELVLLDYASEEGIYGDESPNEGRFDDILWPMLVLKAEVFTNDHSEKGEIHLPADAAWFSQSTPKEEPLPVARGRKATRH